MVIWGHCKHDWWLIGLEHIVRHKNVKSLYYTPETNLTTIICQLYLNFKKNFKKIMNKNREGEHREIRRYFKAMFISDYTPTHTWLKRMSFGSATMNW